MTETQERIALDLDYVELIRKAATDTKMRLAAQCFFGDAVRAGLLLHDDGAHPRMSDMGRCSLEFAAEVRGLHDLERTVDTQLLLLDQGTLNGAWNAALLKAALGGDPNNDASDYYVVLERLSYYQGVPGHADAFVGNKRTTVGEIVEFKLTSGSGQIKSPADGKLYQVAQACGYARSFETWHVPTFAVVTSGANVGNNKLGVPHPKMRQDRFFVSDFRALVDDELSRLKTIAEADPLGPLPDADPNEAWRCSSCQYSACDRNRNSQRLMI